MRASYRPWEDGISESWRVPGGVAQVHWSWLSLGQRVHHHETGRTVPRQFTYMEHPDDQSLPVYLIECSHDDDGTPIVEAVHVVYRPPSCREVRAVHLRHVRPLDDIIEEAFSHIADPEWTDPTELAPEEIQRLQANRRTARRHARGLRAQARRKVTPELLDEVARVYRENRMTGAPTKAVGDHFHVAPSTASLYVKRARDAGLDMGDR